MQEGYPNIAILYLSKAVSQKWCKIGGKLVLITNKKSYMSFRLVRTSVTLNDFEQRNGRYFALFHQIRYLLGRTAYKWLEIYLNFLGRTCSPKHLVFSNVSFTMI